MKASNEKTAAVDRSVSMMLRGLAILIVVFSHYTEWMYIPSPIPKITRFISTLGPIGVDVFLVLSGYGLYMSAVSGAGKSSPGLRFLLKRLSNVYVPYVIIASVLNLITGGSMLRDFRVSVNILTGGDYWYIRVLLVFYIFFMLSFTLFKKIRIAALWLMVVAYTVYLYKSGYRDFWTLSNLAFPIGSSIAAFSLRFSKLWDRRALRTVVSLVSFILAFVFHTLMMYYGDSGKPGTYHFEFLANLFFSVFVIVAASFIKSRKSPVLKLLGASSLFHYLLHTIIFCNLIRHMENAGYMTALFTAALVCTIISAVLYKLYSLLIEKVIKLMIDGRIIKRRNK